MRTLGADTSTLKGGNLLLEPWNAGKDCAVNWLPNWLKSAKPPEIAYGEKAT